MKRFGPAALLLVVIFLQVISGPAWIYSSGFVDSWMYHGYFLNLRYLLATFPFAYYGNRLGWILPGVLAHSLFHPLTANIILRLYLYWIAAISAFSLIRRLYGVRNALLTSLLLCCCPDLMAAVGWDYVDGAVVAYGLLAMEELNAAACLFPENRPLAFVRCGIGGAALAAAIHSNLTVIAMVPLVCLWFFVRAGVRAFRLVPAAAVGAGVLTSVLGLINVWFGGRFLFFFTSLLVLGINARPNEMFYVPPQRWVATAWWLVVPVSACVVCLVSLYIALRARSRNKQDLGRMADSFLIPLAFAIFIAMYFRGHMLLQLPFYSSYFYMFLPLAIGAMIDRRLDSWKRRDFLVLAIGTTVLALLAGARLPTPLTVLVRSISAFRPSVGAALLTLILVAALSIAAWGRPRRISTGVGLVGVAAVLLNLGGKRLDGSSGARAGSSYLSVFAHYSAAPVDANVSKAIYLDSTNTIRRLIQSTSGNRLWMWYSYSADQDAHNTNIASAFIWGDGFLNMAMPDISTLPTDRLRPGHFVAIMDNRPEILEEAVRQLARAGITVERKEWLTSETAGKKHHILLVRVTQISPPPAVSGPLEASAGGLRPTKVFDYDARQLPVIARKVVHGEFWPKYQGIPEWVTRVTDPRDHCATDFLRLDTAGMYQVTSEGARLQVTLSDDRPLENYGDVNMVLQNQDFTSLYSSGPIPHGERQAVVVLPAGTTAIRFVFLPNNRGFIRLPERLRGISLPPAR